MTISLNQISTAHGLRDLSLEIPPGTHMVVCGPSGAGKTTLLRVIAGLEPVRFGTVTINGAAGDLLPPHQRGIGMVFQDLGLWAHLSAGANLALALPRGMGRVARKAAVEQALSQCALGDFARRSLGSLSGGELCRVALARAIIGRPRLLLRDEPFSGLDVSLKDEQATLIASLVQNHGVSSISVVHDAGDAFALRPRRLLCLTEGRITDDVPDLATLHAHPRTPFFQRWLRDSKFPAQ